MKRQSDLKSVPTLRPLLLKNEVAEILRVRPQTLDKWRMEGSGPLFVSVNGRSVRYRRKDVEAFIEASTCSNTLEASRVMAADVVS